MTVIQELTKGLYKENPVFRLMLGLCPTLAVSSSVNNAIGMGASATFVLIASNTVISLIKNIVPDKIRIPVFIIVIATFVTIVELVMAAFFPALNRALGIFIPLIVVNCIILGRAEAFASRNKLFLSVLDGLGMGIGFSLALLVIGSFREILGNGTWYGHPVFGNGYQPVLMIVLPPGAFITIAYLIAFFNWIDKRKTSKS